MTETTLRFLTCGHVDDGKSTLIGRLLFDLNAVPGDQLTHAMSDGIVNLAQITDGLEDERRQGITIDVAYRYFRRGKRHFIVADAPGHLEYLRNMAVAASNSDVALILVDAVHGLRDQTLRHSHVAALFGIRYFVIVINKMDSIGYSAEAFQNLRNEYIKRFTSTNAGTADNVHLAFIPVSALHGDNVAHTSKHMPWYKGPTLAEYLMQLRTDLQLHLRGGNNSRLAIQYSLPGHEGRTLFQAWLSAGQIAVGETFHISGGKEKITVEKLYHSGAEASLVSAPAAVAFVLKGNPVLPRGTILSRTPVREDSSLRGKVLWLDETTPAPESYKGILKLHHRETDVILSLQSANEFLHKATIQASGSLAYDTDSTYDHTRQFLIIDPQSQRVKAVGMLQ